MDTNSQGRLRERTAAEVRAELARQRISAAELARRLGWAQSFMARRIDGRVALNMDDLERIAGVLNVDVHALIPRGSLITDAYPEVPEKMTLPAPHPVDIRRSAHPRPRRRRDLGRTSILERVTACATA